MSDFLDFDALEQDSKDANIIPHPLRDKLSESAKASYIRMIVFAGLADDETLSDIELEYGRTRALSLGLNADEFDEAVKTVQSLGGQQERMKFLREMLTAFTDRAVAMYVLCDMAQAMASDGELTENASKFLDSLYRLLLKSDKKPDNPLTSADQKFLTDYRPFLAPGKTADATEVVREYYGMSYELPAGLVDFFTPDLKPIELKGGSTPAGEFRIVGCRFTLDEKLTVESNTKLILRDSEIDFGANGLLVLEGMRVDIENCTFKGMAEPKDPYEHPWMIEAHGVAYLSFTNCIFDGGNFRCAIEDDGGHSEKRSLVITGGGFRSLKSGCRYIISAINTKVECRKVVWKGCTNDVESDIMDNMIIGGGDAVFVDCVFEDCNAYRLFFGPIEVTHCKFVGCKCRASELFYVSDGRSMFMSIVDEDKKTKISSCVAINCSPDPFGKEGWVTQAEFEKASVCVEGK